jgi:hypothetical protein
MSRSAILPFPASLRALRGPLGPLAALASPDTGVDTYAGPPSLFDSAGASGVTVEVPETEQGAHALHAHLASSPEVSAMLIVDPASLWAPGVMQALADATGAPVDRLRVHSRSGMQIRAVVDETLLPSGAGTHRLVRRLHGNAKPADRRSVFGPLLAHSQVCAVLVGPMPSLEAQALLSEMLQLARLPEAGGVRWLFYLGADHRSLEARIAAQAWPTPPTVLHARPLNRSVSAVWNSLYGAWIHG